MNEIIHRVNDFLKDFPPFTYMDKDTLFTISGKVIVKFFAKGEFIYKEKEATHEFIYVVNKGAVSISNTEKGYLVESCDEGDLFGLRPLLADSAYVFTAQAAEDCIIFSIHVSYLKPILKTNPKVALYVASVFAGTLEKRMHSNVSTLNAANFDPSLAGIENLQDLKVPVTCGPHLTVHEVAKLMTAKNVNSIIVVDANGLPIGIVTDKDLREKVVAGKVKKKAAISVVMNSPVYCMKPTVTVAELQIQIIRRKISHILITEDGSIDTRPVGIVTNQDLVLAESNNPAIIIKQIRKTRNPVALRHLRDVTDKLLTYYLDREISIDYLTEIISEINDQIIKACIRASFDEIDQYQYNEDDFTWIALGSQGRKEQLIRTDQDNGIIYKEEIDKSPEETKLKYLTLAKLVTQKLAVVGYELCPADMMASNPKWCMSIEEWKQTFGLWILEPGQEEILHTSIFLDYRKIIGSPDLTAELTDYIFSIIDRATGFLNLLAKSALLNPPPLTFFRNFVVERNGEHKDAFDIKQRAMLPLADAARLLVLVRKIPKLNNTPERFRKLAEIDAPNKEVYLMAAESYEVLMRFKAKTGLATQSSGRYINPNQLDKFQRVLLRNCFEPINDLQQIIKLRFQFSTII